MQETFDVILVEPRYDGNIGSCARVMANFGFERLVLVKPPKIGAEGRKNSVHARYLMESATVFDSFDEAVKGYDYIIGTTAKTASDSNKNRTPVFIEELGNSLDVKGKIALLFGREDFGLINEEIAKCDMLVTIPTHHKYPTLNLAHSVGIVLYELSRLHNMQRYKSKKFRILNKIEKDVLLRYFDELIDRIYDYDFENNLTKRTFRNILGRSFASGREAKTLTGVFRKSAELIDKCEIERSSTDK